MKCIIRALGAFCILAVLFSFGACQSTNTEEVDSLYNSIDQNHEEKVSTKGTLKLSKSLTENGDSFQLNAILADNMVLQRNAVNCLWGSCEKDGEIAVSINKQTFYGTVENGRFEIYLSPMSAGGPYDMVIFNDTEKLTIKNVLVGEVFLLAGQSNMQMRVAETQPSEEEQQTYANDKIRLFEIKADYEKEEQDNLSGTEVTAWAASSEDSTPYFSAAGYYFAQELQARYPDLPIGLVMCCQVDR